MTKTYHNMVPKKTLSVFQMDMIHFLNGCSKQINHNLQKKKKHVEIVCMLFLHIERLCMYVNVF